MAIPKKMYAAVLEGPNKIRGLDNLKLGYVDTPIPSDNEVLVQVYACGFCQTDLKAIMGKRELPITDDHIVGHEPSGVIAAVGGSVSSFKVGDRVAVSPLAYCGECPQCKRGDDYTHYCYDSTVYGGDGPDKVRNGAFAQYMVIDQKSVYKIPDSISFEDAALSEPIAGSLKGLTRSRVKEGDNVVVIGVGGIGQILLRLGHRIGARMVAVDLSDFALEQARRFGIEDVVNPRNIIGEPTYTMKDIPKITDHIYDKVLRTWPDVVFEAAGPLEALQLAGDMVGLYEGEYRPTRRRDARGIRLNIFGITTPGSIPLEGWIEHFSETEINSSFNVNPACMRAAIEEMKKGFRPAEIITHRFKLEDLEAAIDIMGQQNHNKVMVYPHDEYFPEEN